MVHSAGNYWRRCQSGESRIFAISRDGETIATTELVHEGGTEWTVAQTAAHQNLRPHPDAEMIAATLAAEYSRRHAESLRQTGPDEQTDTRPHPTGD